MTMSDAERVREAADMIEDQFSWTSQRRASAHAADLRRIAKRLEEIDGLSDADLRKAVNARVQAAGVFKEEKPT